SERENAEQPASEFDISVLLKKIASHSASHSRRLLVNEYRQLCMAGVPPVFENKLPLQSHENRKESEAADFLLDRLQSREGITVLSPNSQDGNALMLRKLFRQQLIS